MRNITRSQSRLVVQLASSLLLACATTTSQQATPSVDMPAPAVPAPPRQIVDNSAALTKLVAQRAPGELALADPDAIYWDSVVGGTVTLMGQPMVNPKPEATTTDALQIQALHDGTRIAFRLRWKDPEVSEAGQLAKYSDAVALEFPQRDDVVPAVMMGGPGTPVQLYHWRAQYQRDEQHGKPTITDLYPNASVDMYMHEYKTAAVSNKEAAERYQPAKAVGNPQAYRKRAVDVLLAEGFSTSAVQENDGAVALGAWKDGYWSVVIVRPLQSTVGSAIKAAAQNYVAFAIWQGGKNEVGSRKCVTMAWTPLELQ